MLRNQVAKQLGIDSETLRYYENEKLISQPKRLENGYRFYTDESISEIKFILHCRSLGIGLEEIKVLKNIQNDSIDCSRAKEIIEDNIELIEKKMKELKKLKSQLKALSESCSKPSSAKDCAIVKSLNRASQGESCACHDH